MAGVKGRSGGARPNTGGARPGAGRPRKPQQEVVELPEMDMLRMLQEVALGKVQCTPIQLRAAIAAVQYTHVKRADGGKKEEAAEKADKAAKGRFSAAKPPLKLVNGA